MEQIVSLSTEDAMNDDRQPASNKREPESHFRRQAGVMS
jgi:hypothetical protein